MTLQSPRELRVATEKLHTLEKRYEAIRAKPTTNEHLRELTLRSLKQTMNQLQEEIVRFESRATGSHPTK
jgi:hypothetical protein